MSIVKERFTLIIIAFVYVLFNLRPSPDLLVTARSTLYQMMITAPYVVGITLVIVATLQYMAGGKKVPWDRRLRLFFTIGIIVGFVYAIFEYTGVK